MVIAAPDSKFNSLASLIAIARQRPGLTDLETGLLNVASATLARIDGAVDAEAHIHLMTLAERVESIAAGRTDSPITGAGFHHGNVALASHLAPRWSPCVGIEVRRAA